MNTSPIPNTTPVTNGASAAQPGSPLEEFLVKPMHRYNLALEPQTYDAGWRIAEICAAMHLCGCKKPEDAYLRIIAGRAIGLPAMASVQAIIPIYNKKEDTFTLTMYVKAKVALCLSRPDVIEYVRPSLVTDEKAIWVGKRVGGVELSWEFSIEDAKKAGLVGRLSEDGSNNNNYDKHPKAMLSWRAAGRLLDVMAGDVLNGIASYEFEKDADDDREREDKARGTVPEALQAQIPKRDFAREADALKVRLTEVVQAKDAAGLKEVRGQFKSFESEGPADLVEELKRFYNMIAATSKKTDAPKPAAAVPAPAAQSSLPTTAPAKPAPYLPPNQRGDAYMGPDQPPPPFGAP